jgi:hypothetical protein
MACSAALASSETGVRPDLAVTHGDLIGAGKQTAQPKVVRQTSMNRIVRSCSRGIGDNSLLLEQLVEPPQLRSSAVPIS